MIFKQIIRAIIFYPALIIFTVLAFLLEIWFVVWDLIFSIKPQPDIDGLQMMLSYFNPVIYIKYIKQGSA